MEKKALTMYLDLEDVKKLMNLTWNVNCMLPKNTPDMHPVSVAYAALLLELEKKDAPKNISNKLVQLCKKS